MANDITTTGPNALAGTDPTKWLTPSETSALADRGTIIPFNPDVAAAAFPPARLRELMLRHDAAMMPIEPGKLANRLRALWESTAAPGNLTAKSWLHETGRLLSDLPTAIAYAAIDTVLRENERGFTPGAGAIRSRAEPMLADLRRTAVRLRAVSLAQQHPQDMTEPPDHPHAAGPLDRLSTAEILARVWPTMTEHDTVNLRTPIVPNPDRQCRAPTREDYIRMGVDPALLDGNSTDEQRAA